MGVSMDDTSMRSTVIIMNSPGRAFAPSSELVAVAVTISATSPLAIMPTPAIVLSLRLYLNALATAPQPITLPISPISTARKANRIICPFMPAKVMLLMPIFAKNTGANIVYVFTSTFLSVYMLDLCAVERIMPARNAPVMSATPKISSASHA